MSVLKDLAIIWSARLGVPRILRHGSKAGLTTVLLHHFRFGDESWKAARERLSRQLEFLASAYECISIDEAADYVVGQTNRVGKPPLLLTIDDAKREFLEVSDLFATFSIPVIHFVCAGWSERSSGTDDPEGLELRLVSQLHFYQGAAEQMTIGGHTFTLDHKGNAELIDALIGTTDADDLAVAADLDLRLARSEYRDPVCDWTDLRDLQKQGISIGCHSVSHPLIAQQSAPRQQFEIKQSRAFIERKLGPSPDFAYPYGTGNSHSDRTYEILRQQNFRLAFTTTPELCRAGADPLALPRLVMPDEDMPMALFQARVCGGTIPFDKLNRMLR